MRERIRSERGQTGSEYLGVLLLVGLVAAAMASGLVGEKISYEVQRIICEIAGRQNCAEELAPLDPECLVSSDTTESSFGVSIIAVRIGTGATLIREEYADGRIVYTLVDNAEVAAELLAGVRARAGKYGFNAAASLSAGGRLEGARVYEFGPDERDAANEFGEKVQNEGTITDLLHTALETGIDLGPLGGLLNVGDGIADFIFGDDADDLPAPTATYVSAEAFVNGDFNIGAGIPGLNAELQGALEAAGGAKVYTSGPDAGQVELAFEIDAELAADLGLLTLGPGISGETNVTATMTFGENSDGEYRPLTLNVVGTAGYNGSPLQSSEVLGEVDLADINSSLEEVALTATEGSGHQIEFGAELDLEDPANLRAALGLLNPNSPTAVFNLVRRFAEDGKLTLQVYDTTASDTGIELAAGAGVHGGVDAGQSSDSQDLTGAWVREPGEGWERRRCGEL